MTPRTQLRSTILTAFVVAVGSMSALAQPLKEFDSSTDWYQFSDHFKAVNVTPDRVVVPRLDDLSFDFRATPGAGIAGVQARTSLKGDFHVELKYELETFPEETKAGYAPRFGILLEPTALSGPVAMNRGVWPGYGQQVRLSKTVKVGDKQAYGIHAAPSKSKHGRLALRREGSDIVGLWADTPDGELIELDRLPFTDKAIGMVRFSADPGVEPTAMDFRIYDIQIRSDGALPPVSGQTWATPVVVAPMPKVTPVTSERSATLPGRPDVADPTDPDAPPPAASPIRGLWWLVVIGGAVVFIVGLFIGRKLFARSDEPAEEPIPKSTKVRRPER